MQVLKVKNVLLKVKANWKSWFQTLNAKYYTLICL